MHTAIVIGATGLVGSTLVDQLLTDDRVDAVVIFVRRPTGRAHAKLTEHVIDFSSAEGWTDLVRGDILFSCLGTTLKTAGSKDAQYRIDYHMQYDFALAASRNGVQSYVLLSSAGASPQSAIFYSRMKGELESAVKLLSFPVISIIKPGILDGDRKENRPGEKNAIFLMRYVSRIPGLRKYRPIHASIVAKAMISAGFNTHPGIREYELEEVFKLSTPRS